MLALVGSAYQGGHIRLSICATAGSRPRTRAAQCLVGEGNARLARHEKFRRQIFRWRRATNLRRWFCKWATIKLGDGFMRFYGYFDVIILYSWLPTVLRQGAALCGWCLPRALQGPLRGGADRWCRQSLRAFVTPATDNTVLDSTAAHTSSYTVEPICYSQQDHLRARQKRSPRPQPQPRPEAHREPEQEVLQEIVL